MQKDIIRKIIAKKVDRLKKEIKETPRHKGTEHHLGLLKAKVARLSRELGEKEERSGGGGLGYAVKKQGDASGILIGPPSSGKSTLINALTAAKSKVGQYDFTTLGVVPGMMFYQGARIQIFDVPGLIVGAAFGKGKGKRVLSVARSADLIILMTDVERLNWLERIKSEIYQVGIRLDLSPPKVEIKKRTQGGIEVVDPFNSFNKRTIREIAMEFGFRNAQIFLSEPVKSIDDLIDVFSGNRVYLPSIELINKIDTLSDKKLDPEGKVLISAASGQGLEDLREAIWQKLGLIRVYLKRGKNQDPDLIQPLILRRGNLIKDVAESISFDLSEKVREALIWGPKVKFPGQKVSLSYPLSDGLIVYLVR